MGQNKSFKLFIRLGKTKQTIYHWHPHLLSIVLCNLPKQSYAKQQFACGIPLLICSDVQSVTAQSCVFCFAFFFLSSKGQETLAFVSFRMTPRCSAPPFPGRLQLLVCCPSQCISVWHHPHDVAFARAPVFSMVPNHLGKMLPIAVTHCYRRYKWVLITCVNNKAEAKRFFYFYVRGLACQGC